MRNTKFSLQTDIERGEVTLMCHFKLEGVLNTSTMDVFTFNKELDHPRVDVIDQLDSFNSMCKVFRVGQKFVKQFLDRSLDIALHNNEDICIEHESVFFLRHNDTIERLAGLEEPPSNVETLKRLSGLI